jgi:hypothetical protein
MSAVYIFDGTLMVLMGAILGMVYRGPFFVESDNNHGESELSLSLLRRIRCLWRRVAMGGSSSFFWRYYFTFFCQVALILQLLVPIH